MQDRIDEAELRARVRVAPDPNTAALDCRQFLEAECRVRSTAHRAVIDSIADAEQFKDTVGLRIAEQCFHRSGGKP